MRSDPEQLHNDNGNRAYCMMDRIVWNNGYCNPIVELETCHRFFVIG